MAPPPVPASPTRLVEEAHGACRWWRSLPCEGGETDGDDTRPQGKGDREGLKVGGGVRMSVLALENVVENAGECGGKSSTGMGDIQFGRRYIYIVNKLLVDSFWVPYCEVNAIRSSTEFLSIVSWQCVMVVYDASILICRGGPRNSSNA